MSAPAERRVIDAYGHVSLPRFLSVEQFLGVLDDNGVEAAIVATAATCPDLRELSRAICVDARRLRAVGMPVGQTPQEIEDDAAEQMAAGFLGIRLPAALVVEQPGLLDVIGRAGGVPFVVGPRGCGVAAEILLDYLERDPTALVCAPHFGGAAEAALFDVDPAVTRLFGHPRFLVIFSRQGAYEPEVVSAWAHELVRRWGWERLLFGSEYPVALWRDETYASTVGWIDDIGLTPTPAERDAFLYENARNLLFSRPLAPPRPVAEALGTMEGKQEAPVWLFPRGSLDLPEDVHHRLISRYLAEGGDRTFGSYRAFVAELLARVSRDQ